MSNTDLWTEEDAAAAASQGWQLADIFDLKKSRPIFVILPAQIGSTNPELLARQIANRAVAGDSLARKALTLLVGRHPT